jgi:hypothetical protein
MENQKTEDVEFLTTAYVDQDVYQVFVKGRAAPRKKYSTPEEAEAEAVRLHSEMRLTAIVCKRVIKISAPPHLWESNRKITEEYHKEARRKAIELRDSVAAKLAKKAKNVEKQAAKEAVEKAAKVIRLAEKAAKAATKVVMSGQIDIEKEISIDDAREKRRQELLAELSKPFVPEEYIEKPLEQKPVAEKRVRMSQKINI